MESLECQSGGAEWGKPPWSTGSRVTGWVTMLQDLPWTRLSGIYAPRVLHFHIRHTIYVTRAMR